MTLGDSPVLQLFAPRRLLRGVGGRVTWWMNPQRMAAMFAVVVSMSLSAGAIAQVPIVVEIFTSDDIPISIGDSRDPARLTIKIYRIDGLGSMANQLSKGLPTDASDARREALGRLKKLTVRDRAALEASATSLLNASLYGIDRFPAFVFDGRAVVYGRMTVSQSLTVYASWRSGTEQ